MTQEEKQLLLIDLCARLPYGVICNELGQAKKLLSVSPSKAYGIELDNGEYTRGNYKIGDIKPYLRPMSSMTDEEISIYNKHIFEITTGIDAANFMIWIYKHHLDIFHFIEKGLALEAPKDMYK